MERFIVILSPLRFPRNTRTLLCCHMALLFSSIPMVVLIIPGKTNGSITMRLEVNDFTVVGKWLVNIFWSSNEFLFNLMTIRLCENYCLVQLDWLKSVFMVLMTDHKVVILSVYPIYVPINLGTTTWTFLMNLADRACRSWLAVERTRVTHYFFSFVSIFLKIESP